jgi:hypothetical protein
MAEFHQLAGFTELTDAVQLTLRRTRTLVQAVGDAGDYTLLQLLARGNLGVGRIEVLVVDVECDGVSRPRS